MPNESPEQRRPVRTQLRAVGISLLFSGVALVTYILSGVSLRLALFVGALLPLAAFRLVWKRMGGDAQRILVVQLKVGLAAAVIATGAYDLTRFMLSHLDTSPYNPFEVIRIFGTLLVGNSAATPIVYSVGTAFHIMNGLCFGIAYWLLFGRYGVPAAVLWGAFLEVFQLTLYPGWLNIRFYREFLQISAASHLIYGAVLGFGCKSFHARFKRQSVVRTGV
ncbi:MAG TPA: hypothetical protein VNH65_07515 [Candidatus Acidoferrum sp.]|nr:hypothetical protein [Candidatus Acidoferrum sp.]